MKPLSYARRGARWLMAAGIAVAMLTPAGKPRRRRRPDQPGAEARPRQSARRQSEAGPGRALLHQERRPRRSCDYVVYSLSFGLRGDPQGFADPSFVGQTEEAQDRLQGPASGRSCRSSTSMCPATARMPCGGPLPGATISTSANPNDTATVSDFRLSATDLDGAGAPNERVITFKITAKIDHAAFPAPTIVDNQGMIKVTPEVGTRGHHPVAGSEQARRRRFQDRRKDLDQDRRHQL